MVLEWVENAQSNMKHIANILLQHMLLVHFSFTIKKTDSQHFSQLQLTAAVCGVFYDRGLAQYRVQLLEGGVSFFSLHHWPFTFSVSLTSAHSLFRSRQDARGVNDTDALQNLVGQLRTLKSNNTLSFI